MQQRNDGEWGRGVNTDDLTALAERGRQLHSKAVFDACARLLNPLKGASAGKSARFVAGDCELTSR